MSAEVEEVVIPSHLWGKKCPACGCELEPYEVFASRLRGLATPVCYGCLANALVWLKKYLMPMLDTALKMLEGK